MSKTQYGFVLLTAVIASLIGGATASWLFPPRVLRAVRFEAVDKRGEIRMTLDKSGLFFFPRKGETAPVVFDADAASLKLYGSNVGDRLELSAVNRFLRPSDYFIMLLRRTGEKACAIPNATLVVSDLRLFLRSLQ